MRYLSSSPAETFRLGRLLGELAHPGDIFALIGELGAGKTVLVKGVAKGLGYDPAAVTSPTFVLLNEYQAALPIYHFDAYRLNDAKEMFALGCEEKFFGEGLSLVEWADRVLECLPSERLDVTLRHASESEREIELAAHGPRYEQLIQSLRERLDET